MTIAAVGYEKEVTTVRLLDADWILEHTKPYEILDEDWSVAGSTAIRLIHNAIDQAPTIDAVPAVRCKCCKYGDYDSKPGGAMVCLRTKDGFWRKETDFCSYGTPKNDGGETEK